MRRPAIALALVLRLTLSICGCADPTGGPHSEALSSAEDGEGALSDKAAATRHYEAESRTAQSGTAVASNNAGYTGAGFVDFGDNGSYIEWSNINATRAGQYTLTLRYANGGNSARPATVSVNGTTAGTVQFDATGDWTSWRTTSLVVSLRQGNNTVRVRVSTTSGGPNVDHAEVTAKDLCTSDPNKTDPGECGCGKPEGSCSSSTWPRYEAENRTAQNGTAVASNNAGFTGSGFVDFGGNGTWIEWNNISAPQAGQHTLTLRYANGGTSARPAAVAVNGTAAGTVQFSSTAAWTAWNTASIAVSLRQGNNTIRITANTSAGGPNLDRADLALPVVTDLCPSDPNKTAPGTCGCGVPEGTCGGTSTMAVKLPIEVLGPAGTTETVQVQVDDPTNVTHLYLRCNSCGYHDSDLDRNASMVKATVSINGGAAIALKRYTGGDVDVGNTNIEIVGVEADYGGIGGVFRTVRMKVPVSGLRRGTNSITFVHKTPAPPSIGFRIIELNLLRSGAAPMLAAASFTQDDPTTWKAPLTAASDIEAGRVLWNARSRLNDPGVDAINGSANGRIVASCADCHASDGRDLAYFNFSNRSIVERSIFHGLSRTEGERIASYIRSRTLPKVLAARPWNPTYQPGPGLDAKPVYEWAAGAGLGAILDEDLGVKNDLFPNDSSISLDDVRRVGSRFSKLNMRELRVALPMPEWNQWLPHIHPDDAFNTSTPAIRQDSSGNSISEPYYTNLYKAALANPSADTIGNMTTRVKSWLQRGMTCDTNGAGNGEPWRGLNGGVLSAIKLPKKTYSTCVDKEDRSRADEEAYEISKRGLAAWIAVKQWEIVHSKNLEDEGKKTQTATVPYTGGSRTLSSNSVCSSSCVDARERGWFVKGRNVFDRPPHFTGHNSRHYYGQDIVTGVAETNSWYHLNMVLNPGYRIMMPTHFAYVCSHIEIMQAESGVDQGFRFWASMIKQRQLQTNGLYGAETGHDLRTSQPHVYYKANRNGTSQTQASVGQPLWGYLAQAMVEDFVADADRATRAHWEAATNNSAVQAWDSRDFSTGNTFDTGEFQGRNTYRVIPRLREIGVSPSVVSSLITWGKKTWPNGNWDAIR